MADRTPLYPQHLASHAHMVNFHGWDMPLHYGSSLKEHQTVRTDAGMFDVSHMSVLDVTGEGSAAFLRTLLTNDVALLKPGKALYSCMCNENGGVLDDLIVYQRAPLNYRLILNSATHDADLAWIKQQSQGLAVHLNAPLDLAIIAIQGPQAIARLCTLLPESETQAICSLKRFECVDFSSRFFARTGYTGEDGVEVILPKKSAIALWQGLVRAGVLPCGLAARDSLRLEAGYLLYGQDMTDHTTPLESGLHWTIKWSPDRIFIGQNALENQKNNLSYQLVGLTLLEPGIMRPGQPVLIPHHANGIITSGGYAPSLQCSIALARVPVMTHPTVQVEIRNKLLKAKVGPPRFYPVKKGDVT